VLLFQFIYLKSGWFAASRQTHEITLLHRIAGGFSAPIGSHIREHFE
jgi:hypothetical protein